ISMFCISMSPPPCSTLFPYTTLFRSSRPERGETVFPLRNPVPHGRPPKKSWLPFPDLQGGLRSSRPRDATGRTQGSGRRNQAKRSEEHTSELQSLRHLVCRLLLEKKK